MRSHLLIAMSTSVTLMGAATTPGIAQSAEETAAFLLNGMSDTGSEPGTLTAARNLERLSDDPLTFRLKIDMIDQETQQSVVVEGTVTVEAIDDCRYVFAYDWPRSTKFPQLKSHIRTVDFGKAFYPPLSSSTVYWPSKNGMPYEYRQDTGFSCSSREGEETKCYGEAMHGSILRDPTRIMAAVDYFNTNICRTKAF